MRADGRGYEVVDSYYGVLVLSGDRVLFKRKQPTSSPGFAQVDDPRIFHRETHDGMTCYWTRLAGGGAGCNRADLHGYVVFVSKQIVAVSNEASKIVYITKQP
jgi:hypothetical protein